MFLFLVLVVVMVLVLFLVLSLELDKTPRKRVREDGEVRYRKQSRMKRFQGCRQYQESLRMWGMG